MKNAGRDSLTLETCEPGGLQLGVHFHLTHDGNMYGMRYGDGGFLPAQPWDEFLDSVRELMTDKGYHYEGFCFFDFYDNDD